MITNKQIALVHVAKKQLGIDDALYRDVLRGHGGVETAADLDARGFERVMTYFTACGFRSDWTKRTFGHRRDGMATPYQINLIRELFCQWSGRNDEAALNAWIERSYRVSALRFLDRGTASKAINGLRAMLRRKRVAA